MKTKSRSLKRLEFRFNIETMSGFRKSQMVISIIYFGGVGKPDGPGHGHYVMDQKGNVTYRREPFDPHGAQNFEETRREEATLRMSQIAINQWARSAATPRVLQSEDSDFKV